MLAIVLLFAGVILLQGARGRAFRIALGVLELKRSTVSVSEGGLERIYQGTADVEGLCRTERCLADPAWLYRNYGEA